MMKTFSTKLIYDLYTDCITEGYLGMINGLLDILVYYKDRLQYCDYYSILDRLCFCYYYGEYDQQNSEVIRFSDHYPELWETVIKHTDALEEIWMKILSTRSPNCEIRYFGHNSYLYSVCALTR